MRVREDITVKITRLMPGAVDVGVHPIQDGVVALGVMLIGWHALLPAGEVSPLQEGLKGGMFCPGGTPPRRESPGCGSVI